MSNGIDMTGSEFLIRFTDDGKVFWNLFECIEWTDERRVFQCIVPGPHHGAFIRMDWMEYLDQCALGWIALEKAKPAP